MTTTVPQQDYVADPWLDGYIGKPCWRAVDARRLPASPTSLSASGFAYAKLPPDAIDALSHLVKQGFALVETSVTLAADSLTTRGVTPDAGITIRDAIAEDHNGVCAVARQAFTLSRFHIDPAIPSATANAIKAGWAGNFFSGKRGDRMIVAAAAGHILGFLQLLSPAPGAWIIDLIGVDQASRGRNIGAAMIGAISRAASDAMTVTVGTQLRNYRSLAFYQGMGFRITSTSHVLHVHW